MSLTVKEILTLSCLNGVGAKTIFKVASQAGENLIGKVKECGLKVSENGLKVPCDMNHLDDAQKKAEMIMKNCASYGIGIISYYDDQYPDKLRMTIDQDGKQCPPALIYYKGDVSLLKKKALTVIGTRNPNDDGKKAARYLSKSFSEAGLVIVSGLAIGCDSEGHKGAIDAHASTIAVMAGGLDSIYPKENEGLAQEIIDNGGLLISEYAPLNKVNKFTLVDRDRLQAALADATLVIQAGVKSGTMHAAKTTLKAKKPLFVTYYNNEATRNNEVCSGNEYLMTMGAKYLKGNDDLKKIADNILNHE